MNSQQKKILLFTLFVLACSSEDISLDLDPKSQIKSPLSVPEEQPENKFFIESHSENLPNFLESTTCIDSNCKICTEENGWCCTECVDGYINPDLTVCAKDSCVKCEDHFDGCDTCDSTTCTKCQEGYSFDSSNDCKKDSDTCTIKNCETCNDKNTECNKCEDDYSWLSTTECGECKLVDPNCETCSPTEKKCEKCKDTDSLNTQGQCESCTMLIKNCDKCSSSSKCTDCKEGFDISDDKKECTESLNCKVDNCSECVDGETKECKTCNTKYFVDDNTCNKCSSEIKHCENCSSKSYCTTASERYYAKKGKVDACFDNCKSCKDGDSCQECDDDFTESKDKTSCTKLQKSLSVGAIIGITIAALAVVSLGVLFCCKQMKMNKKKSDDLKSSLVSEKEV